MRNEAYLARGTRERVLVLAQLLAQHLVGRSGRFDLLHALHASLQLRQLLL